MWQSRLLSMYLQSLKVGLYFVRIEVKIYVSAGIILLFNYFQLIYLS